MSGDELTCSLLISEITSFSTIGLENYRSHERLKKFLYYINYFFVGSAIKIPYSVLMYRYFSTFPPLFLTRL